MDNTEDLNKNYSNRIVAKNTIYNLLGYGIPLFIAIILIPPLVKNLGEERFGILNLAWIVIGYFSFFDFGIGRSLTKITAEKIGLNLPNEIPRVIWSSLLLILVISLFVAVGAFFIIPSLVNNFLNISSSLKSETLITFYALAFSVPIIATTAALRGILEAYQKFMLINIVRVVLGIFTFLAPLLVLIITDSLFWIVISLILLRLLIWFFYFTQCIKLNAILPRKLKFDFKSIKPVLSFSMWIFVANIISPIILYTDRFLIGVLVSATAITYYSVPYEVVTKLLLIPTSLTVVLFPIFSASFIRNPDLTKQLLLRGIKFVFLILYPFVLLMISFSYEGLNLWLGEKFADNGTFILQFLSIGILFNSVASIPNNFFQGIGRPKVPTVINLIELPFFVAAMWFAIKNIGINGAAIVAIIAAVVDTLIMFFIVNKWYDIKFKSKSSIFSFIFLMLGLIIPFFITNLPVKIIYVSSILIIFMYFVWNYWLSAEEKIFIKSRLKMQNLLVNN